MDSLTRIALINAIYFKGDWRTKFKKAQTTSRPFTVNGQTFDHPETMVTNSFFKMGAVPELDASVLELPYADEDYRMLVFLPNDESPNAVRDLDRDAIDISRMFLKLFLNLSLNLSQTQDPKCLLNCIPGSSAALTSTQ